MTRFYKKSPGKFFHSRFGVLRKKQPNRNLSLLRRGEFEQNLTSDEQLKLDNAKKFLFICFGMQLFVSNRRNI